MKTAAKIEYATYGAYRGSIPKEMRRQIDTRVKLINRMVVKGVFGMKESVIERYLVKRVRELGGEIRKVVFPGHRGAPDRVIFWPSQGNVVWVETKSPTGKLRPTQIREHATLRTRCRQTVVVVRTMEEVDWLVGDNFSAGFHSRA